MKKRIVFIVACLAIVAAAASAAGADRKIYWGDSFPEGWNGQWPAKLLTVPEKTNWERTATSLDVLEFVDVLRWSSDKLQVINMFTTSLRKTCPVVVLANPRVSSPEEAVKSGKTVVYLQGNIHPYEPEAKEALMMLMRDILFGKRQNLLDNLIIIVCPAFNVDGTDTLSLGNGTPHILGSGDNAQGINLNRDGVRVDTIEVSSLYRTVFNRWDPILIYDGHLMGRVQHGYAIAYTNCTVPAAHPGPRGYVFDKLFPAVREATRNNFGLEVFTHCGTDRNWPPTIWTPEQALWTTEAKFIANAYGLRSRMSILAETPGHESFQRRIYAQYALIAGILEFANANGREMQEVCRKADAEVVEAVRTKAESGELTNFVAGKYESYGKVDLLMYRERNMPEYFPGTSVRGKMAAHMLQAPELVKGVDFLAKPVGTVSAKVPRGYLIPAEFASIAEKLRTHNVKVEVLDKPIKVSGEEFAVDKIVRARDWGYVMVKLEGKFQASSAREFPAGTFLVDMAQPAANTAFYCLEPQAADGFAGWGLLEDHLKSIGGDTKSVPYPFFKYFKVL
ncbi:MAG: M14 family metallopeptidase [Candidatus Aminicenantales bacterium]